MIEKLRVLRVAVLPPSPFNCCLDYLSPESGGQIQPGFRVRIPLGRLQRVGIVVGERDQTTVPLERLKPIEATLDDKPLLSDELLKLLEWTASYYHYPLNQVLSLALPSLICKGKPLSESYPTVWSAVETSTARTAPSVLQPVEMPQELPKRACRQAGGAESGGELGELPKRTHRQAGGAEPGGELGELPKRAYRQRQLLDFLKEKGGADEALLNERFGQWRPAMKALRDKGLVVGRPAIGSYRATASSHQLNHDQTTAVQAISNALGRFSCEVLEGVTGSGKTEVYLNVAERVLSSNRQVLVLVPEIGLTGETVRQFQQRFGEVVEVMHSGMTPVNRMNAWSRVYSGNARVVVGPRSVVFAPMPELGLIVVDEEHDLSYKQQDTLRYHARDLAVKRAKLSDVPVILGSATLSLETLHNVRQSHYRHHQLKRRVLDARMPEYRLINLCAQPIKAGLSLKLRQMIQDNLDNGGQTLLFLNRRGYAPRLLCHDCGTVLECSECDIPFTYYQKDGNLRCHHCGNHQPRPVQCAECGSVNFRAVGVGTERIEEGLSALFPKADIVRIDADSVRRKGEFEKKFERVRSGRAGILVGTQMIAKGHHFPNVTLVGILGVDQRLFAVDFRSLERLGQLIVQVSGRAGRASVQGVVALQTYHPSHAGLQTLLRSGYSTFADQLLEQREATAMPPYRHLTAFRADAKVSSKAYRFLESVARQARRCAADGTEILGPMPMMMEKRAGFSRAQLLLFAERRSVLRRCLAQVLPTIAEERSSKDFAWHLDIDPMELD